MSKKASNITLSGHNIYRDKKNRTIYYDFISKNGYIVGREDEGKLFIYKNRFPIIIVAAALTIELLLTPIQAVIAGIICAILVEIFYRLFVFKRMQISKSFVRKERISPIQAIIEQKTKGKIIALIFLYLALAILILVNAYLEKYSIGLVLVSGLVSVFSLYFTIIHIIALFKMNK